MENLRWQHTAVSMEGHVLLSIQTEMAGGSNTMCGEMLWIPETNTLLHITAYFLSSHGAGVISVEVP